ncbi:MAG: hypothetical protein ACTSUE_02835 [Promethearchaeota archaeon]
MDFTSRSCPWPHQEFSMEEDTAMAREHLPGDVIKQVIVIHCRI